MKKGSLQAHLKAKHGAYKNYDLNQFKHLMEKFEKRSTIDSLFSVRNANLNRTLKSSNEISLFIAKSGTNHPIGEDLINFSQNSSGER
jgi:hypothetical protein